MVVPAYNAGMGRPRKERDENEPQPRQRLSVPLNDDGTVDLDGMRGSTREKFQDAALAYLEAHGNEIDGGEVQPELFGGITTENIRAAIDIVSQANALVFRVGAARFTKHPFKKDRNGKPTGIEIEPDILMASFRLTDEQHAELDPRALALARKHGKALPDWLQKNLDLYMLCGMFLKYTAENAGNALKQQIGRDVSRMNAELLKRAQATANRTPGDSDAVKAVPPQPANGHAAAESFEPGHVPDGMVPEPPPEQPLV